MNKAQREYMESFDRKKKLEKFKKINEYYDNHAIISGTRDSDTVVSKGDKYDIVPRIKTKKKIDTPRKIDAKGKVKSRGC